MNFFIKIFLKLGVAVPLKFGPSRRLSYVLYVSTSIWVLRTLNASQNLLFYISRTFSKDLEAKAYHGNKSTADQLAMQIRKLALSL